MTSPFPGKQTAKGPQYGKWFTPSKVFDAFWQQFVLASGRSIPEEYAYPPQGRRRDDAFEGEREAKYDYVGAVLWFLRDPATTDEERNGMLDIFWTNNSAAQLSAQRSLNKPHTGKIEHDIVVEDPKRNVDNCWAKVVRELQTISRNRSRHSQPPPKTEPSPRRSGAFSATGAGQIMASSRHPLHTPRPVNTVAQGGIPARPTPSGGAVGGMASSAVVPGGGVRDVAVAGGQASGSPALVSVSSSYVLGLTAIRSGPGAAWTFVHVTSHRRQAERACELLQALVYTKIALNLVYGWVAPLPRLNDIHVGAEEGGIVFRVTVTIPPSDQVELESRRRTQQAFHHIMKSMQPADLSIIFQPFDCCAAMVEYTDAGECFRPASSGDKAPSNAEARVTSREVPVYTHTYTPPTAAALAPNPGFLPPGAVQNPQWRPAPGVPMAPGGGPVPMYQNMNMVPFYPPPGFMPWQGPRPAMVPLGPGAHPMMQQIPYQNPQVMQTTYAAPPPKRTRVAPTPKEDDAASAQSSGESSGEDVAAPPRRGKSRGRGRTRQQGSIDQDQHGRPRLWEKLEAKHPQQKDSYLCKPCNKAMGNKFSILRHCTMVHKDDPRFAHCWHRCKDNECSCGKLFLEERAIEHHLRQIRFAHRKKKTEGAVTGSGAKPKRARQARRPSPPESAETPGSQDSEPHPPSMTAKGIVGITVGRDESDTAESAD